jgi:hypothetical protein
MKNDIPIQPMSGTDVPYKDLQSESPIKIEKKQAPPPQLSTKQINKLKKVIIILAGLLAGVLIALGWILSIMWQTDNRKMIVPTPKPEATAAPTGETDDESDSSLSRKVEILEKDLNELDLQELDLSFPILDWEIKY